MKGPGISKYEALALVGITLFMVSIALWGIKDVQDMPSAEPVKPPHIYKEICLAGVTYWTGPYKRELAVKINKDTLKPERCDVT